MIITNVIILIQHINVICTYNYYYRILILVIIILNYLILIYIIIMNEIMLKLI